MAVKIHAVVPHHLGNADQDGERRKPVCVIAIRSPAAIGSHARRVETTQETSIRLPWIAAKSIKGGIDQDLIVERHAGDENAVQADHSPLVMAGEHPLRLFQMFGQWANEIVRDVSAFFGGHGRGIVDQIVAEACLDQKHAGIATVEAIGLEVVMSILVG